MTVDEILTKCNSIDYLEIRNTDNEIFEGFYDDVKFYEVLHFNLEVYGDSKIKMTIWI